MRGLVKMETRKGSAMVLPEYNNEFVKENVEILLRNHWHNLKQWNTGPKKTKGSTRGRSKQN